MGKGGNTLKGSWEILIHPDLKIQPKEVALLWRQGDAPFDDYLANKLGTETHWQVDIYDLPENEEIEFFLKFFDKDGCIYIANKDGENYRVMLKPGQDGTYRARVKVTNIVDVGSRCLLCESQFPRGTNACPKCGAVYCPTCHRMLPPKSNYCPWEDLTFEI
ncbi:MAG TPA: zinc ribbon domain-containing protein [Candidatus Lokiarchaeia archaeon]|nr:zinc ribbon domain-containing protein [Candidatus Lokiarchaeia archaeon]